MTKSPHFNIKSILAISFLISISLIAGRSTNSSHTVRDEPLQGIVDTRYKETPKREKYRGVEVAGRETLIKLETCNSENPQAFLDRLTQWARELTHDDHAKVTQVVNACWFSIKSSQLSVNKLMEPFLFRMNLKNTSPDPQQVPPVIDVEPNFVIQLEPQPSDIPVEDCPNDDLFQQGKLWGLSNREHAGVDVDAVRAWGFSKGSENIVVGVIDTGLYYKHPDLADNVWSAPEPFEVRLGTELISCAADTHGYNALGESAGKMCDPLDGNKTRGHGTLVSGIIGAVGNNNKGVVGVNWTTKLIGLKFIGPSGGEVVDAAKAIEFAIQVRKKFGTKANIRVLNASWGYRDEDGVSDVDSNFLRDTIERAGNSGILFVASAGQNRGSDNDKVHHYPSGFDLPNLISVTAIDKQGSLAVMSGNSANFGEKSVHLAAPGRGIYSTYSINLGYCYYVSSGTSMAAPFVSGAGALILSVPRCSNLSANELKSAIMRGVVPTPVPIKTATGGMLNVYRSIGHCVDGR